MALDLTTPFVWGQGGARMTPEEIAQQRKVAESLLASGMDYSPIKSPWQGAARVAQAILGGLESGEASAASKANAAESGKLIAALLGGGASPAATTDAAPAAPIASGAAVPAGQTTIPSGSIDPRLSAAISSAAGTSGVDPAYMTRLALVENGGKVEGGSPLSSATGPFQFINSTAKKYGLTNPNDPAAAADAAARLTLDNKAALTQALGREPTPGELYLAHQQGAGGAAKLLANPNAPVEQVIGQTAAANNGAVPGMTAGQFASKWTNKFADLGQPQVVDANAASPLDTAQYPAGPVGAPTAIAGNAGGIPVVNGDQSSPLDTAMYPAGPVGAPMMAASGTADGVGPAVLPVNAQPVQGTLPTAQAVQAAPAAAPSARPAINTAIIQAMTSPYVDQQTKAIAGMLFKSQMDAQAKAADPLRRLQIQEAQTKLTPIGEPYKDTDGNLVQKDALGKVTVLNAGDKTPNSVLEYKYYRDNFQPSAEKQRPMDYDTWATAKARAAATMINNNVGTGETSFEKEGGKLQATRFNDLVEGGQQAKQMMADVGTLTELGKNIGTGKAAQFKAIVGPYADALNIPVKGLSDIQAYEAIVNRVAPTLRVKGSGAQSDFELKNFLKSLPSLGNTEEGNQIAASVMNGLQQNKVLAAEIGSKALNGEITRGEADKQLRNLPDPMQPYRDFQKTRGTVQPQQVAPSRSAIEAEMKRRGLL